VSVEVHSVVHLYMNASWCNRLYVSCQIETIRTALRNVYST